MVFLYWSIFKVGGDQPISFIVLIIFSSCVHTTWTAMLHNMLRTLCRKGRSKIVHTRQALLGVINWRRLMGLERGWWKFKFYLSQLLSIGGAWKLNSVCHSTYLISRFRIVAAIQCLLFEVEMSWSQMKIYWWCQEMGKKQSSRKSKGNKQWRTSWFSIIWSKVWIEEATDKSRDECCLFCCCFPLFFSLYSCDKKELENRWIVTWCKVRKHLPRKIEETFPSHLELLH